MLAPGFMNSVYDDCSGDGHNDFGDNFVGVDNSYYGDSDWCIKELQMTIGQS